MKTLVYLRNEAGEIRCEEPRLYLGQKFEDAEAVKYMGSLNKNIKAGYKYREVLLIERCENFYNYKHKKNHIDAVMAINGWNKEAMV